MDRRLLLMVLALALLGCHKKNDKVAEAPVDIEKIKKENAKKATIAVGIYGTVIFQQGNCMPVAGPVTGPNPCKTYPVSRVVRAYEYTTIFQAVREPNTPYYKSFPTKLIKETTADKDGFFQLELAPGDYSIVACENGQICITGGDGYGGIGPAKITTTRFENNILINNKAYY
ncbi:MAG: hypothetical protein J7578_02920 [Chitinophagaceae bacterium]|nr:hypothetical protein [Chitinophagaceae bacterium]